ncbi:MAG: hypothetical protein AB9882_07595 [Ignavibacteriaceae bacterium]
MSKKTLLFVFLTLPAIILLYFLGHYLLTNETDQYWTDLDKILISNGIVDSSKNLVSVSKEDSLKFRIIPVQETYDSLLSYYKIFQENNPDAIPFENVVDKPYPLIGSAGLYFSFLEKLLEKKSTSSSYSQNKIILQGVSGSGKTTLIDRMSLLITGSEDNILRLICVEKMEVEYNKEYIGEYRNGKFIPGKFLNLIDKCYRYPDHNFVFILDDVDKVYPSPVFGAQIWNSLDVEDRPIQIDGYAPERLIPSNLFIISATHSEPGYTVEINAEIRRRLGNIFELNADPSTFLLFIKTRIAKDSLSFSHIKRMVYFFKRANDHISVKFDAGFTLGNWSGLRKLVKEIKFDDFINEFVINITNFNSTQSITKDEFAHIIYAMENEGVLSGSSPMHMVYKKAEELGLVGEIGGGLVLALIPLIFGWFLIRRRKKKFEDYSARINELSNKFKTGSVEYIDVIKEMQTIKHTLETDFNKNRIKNEDYILLLILYNNAIGKIHQLEQSYDLRDQIEKKRDYFLLDGIIEQSEKNNLNELLAQKKKDIQPEVYLELWERINR